MAIDAGRRIAGVRGWGFGFVVLSLCVVFASNAARAVTQTWNGNGLDNKWSTPDNWSPPGLPQSGATLVFPDVAARKSNQNDLTDLAVASIIILGNDYVIGGNAITLSGGISANTPATGNPSRFNVSVKLTQPQQFTATGSQALGLFGDYDLNGNQLSVSNSVLVSFENLVSGAGGIMKFGNGILRLDGNNTYSGLTIVNAGILQAGHTNALGAAGAGNGTLVSANASLQLINNTTGVPESITLNGSGAAGVIGALSVTGCAIGCSVSGPVKLESDASIGGTASNQTLTLNGAIGDGTLTFNLTKAGAAKVVLGASNTYHGVTLINQGVLELATGGSIGATLINGGTLGGTGTAASIASQATGGTVAPGSGPGILNVGGNVVFAPQTGFAVEIGGTTAGTQHDRLVAGGTVNLGGANLSVSFSNGFTPGPNDTFTIIQSTGAITGQFAQGGYITVAGTKFRINYRPNSVVLGSPVRIWTGAGANAHWTTEGNWLGGIAPAGGEDLVFPAGTAQRTNVNTLPALTPIQSVTITGDDYHIGGNPIVLAAGISANVPGGLAPNFQVPIVLGAAQTFANDGDDPLVLLDVDLNGHALTLDANAGALTFIGTLSGAGSITKTGAQSVFLQPSVGNTFSGPTFVQAGSLIAGSDTGLGNAGSGNGTVVAEGVTLEFRDAASIAESLDIAGLGVDGTDALRFSCSGCALSGAINVNGIVAVEVGASTLATIESGITQTGSGGLRKFGVGTLILAGANSLSGGLFAIEGTLSVNGSAGDATIDGGTLGGRGQLQAIDALASGGTLAPGNKFGDNKFGILHASTVTLAPQATVAVKLAGPTPGTQHDQLSTSGGVALNGANLSVALIDNFTPGVGSLFTIVRRAVPSPGNSRKGRASYRAASPTRSPTTSTASCSASLPSSCIRSAWRRTAAARVPCAAATASSTAVRRARMPTTSKGRASRWRPKPIPARSSPAGSAHARDHWLAC